MNPTLPADRFWGKPLATLALQAGYVGATFDIYDGRWYIFLFLGMVPNEDYGYTPSYIGIPVQEFYKSMLLGEPPIKFKRHVNRYNINEHKRYVCATG